MRVLACFIVLVAVAAALAGDSRPAITKEFVDELNAHAEMTWVADHEQPYWFGATIASARGRMGVKASHFTRSKSLLPEKPQAVLDLEAPLATLPVNFSSAANWPSCYTIDLIRDQSACGSCWAFGAAEAISDRYCIHMNLDINISASTLNSCSHNGGDSGCGGGEPSAAWAYWVNQGLPDQGCDPYPFPECQHHGEGLGKPCPVNEYNTPPCVKKCKNNETWSTALHYGAKAYSITSGETAMMQEIMANGPVETAFSVYEDFLTYRSGVYTHVSGPYVGGHAVKIVGWGVTSTGEKYWVVNNSWNSGWGQNGQFWIKRGVNECGIEDEIDMGLPKN